MNLWGILTIASVAVPHPASAETSRQVHARDDGQPIPREPLVFWNLTVEEFDAKRREYRGAPGDKRATGDLGHLEKRYPYLHEVLNPYFKQMVVEERSATCESRFGIEYRVTTGYCPSHRRTRMLFTCRHKTLVGNQRESSQTCPPNHVCASVRQVINFLGHSVQIPYCAEELQINQRTDESADAVPSYEGHRTIPEAPQPPEPPHSPSVLDSIDQIWHIEDGHIPGLTGQWDYRGRYSNGNGFSSRSFGMAHSWSCIGCPAGTLYVETVGFKATALGSVLLS